MKKEIVFIGGTYVGYRALNKLIDMKANIVSVFTYKEHKHEKEQYYDMIQSLSQQNNILSYVNESSENMYEKILNLKPDIIMCFGLRNYIPPKIYNLSNLCSVGTHFSLLPKYRGFAPVNWAIINGEKETGISLFHLSEGIDEGEILSQRVIPIDEEETTKEVIDKCIIELEKILNEELVNFEKEVVKRIKQDESLATYTCARSPEDGKINWNDSTKNICNLIRALTTPFPGAYTHLRDEKIIFLEAKPVNIGNYVGRIPGKIVKILKGEGIITLTGDGAMLIKKISIDNKEGIRADDYIKSIRQKFI